ncbi:MAG TPA: hypothetical protein VMZ22_09285 [Acidimicrobiales bacterium]|nr:hypothetical protein [Acidimicrobiales bacterium]
MHAQVLLAAVRISDDHMHGADKALERAQAAWELIRDTDAAASLKAVCLGWTAEFLRESGAIDEAVRTFDQSVAWAADLPATRCVTQALFGRALLHSGIQAARARHLLDEALATAQHSGSLRGEWLARLTLAWDAGMRGERGECEAVLAPLRVLADQLHPVVATSVLADAARELVGVGSVELAREYAAASMEAATRSGQVEAVVESSFTRGTVAAALGDMVTAEREWTVSAEVAARQARPVYAMLARYRLAWLMEERGDVVGERRMLEEAKPFALRVGGMPRMVWFAYYGDALLKAGDGAGARAHLRKAIELTREQRHDLLEGALLTTLADVCFERGRFDDAVRVWALCHATASFAQMRASGSTMSFRRRQRRIAELESMFSPGEYAALEKEGRGWTLDDLDAVVDDLTTEPEREFPTN